MFKGAAPIQNHNELTLAQPRFWTPSLLDDTLILFASQPCCCAAKYLQETAGHETAVAALAPVPSYKPACGFCLLAGLWMSRRVAGSQVWTGSGLGAFDFASWEHVCGASVP